MTFGSAILRLCVVLGVIVNDVGCDWLWTSTDTSRSSSLGFDATIDSQGNVICLGMSDGPVEGGISESDPHAVLVAWSKEGETIWKVDVPNTDAESAEEFSGAIAIDSDDYFWVVTSGSQRIFIYIGVSSSGEQFIFDSFMPFDFEDCFPIQLYVDYNMYMWILTRKGIFKYRFDMFDIPIWYTLYCLGECQKFVFDNSGSVYVSSTITGTRNVFLQKLTFSDSNATLVWNITLEGIGTPIGMYTATDFLSLYLATNVDSVCVHIIQFLPTGTVIRESLVTANFNTSFSAGGLINQTILLGGKGLETEGSVPTAVLLAYDISSARTLWQEDSVGNFQSNSPYNDAMVKIVTSSKLCAIVGTMHGDSFGKCDLTSYSYLELTAFNATASLYTELWSDFITGQLECVIPLDRFLVMIVVGAAFLTTITICACGMGILRPVSSEYSYQKLGSAERKSDENIPQGGTKRYEDDDQQPRSLSGTLRVLKWAHGISACCTLVLSIIAIFIKGETAWPGACGENWDIWNPLACAPVFYMWLLIPEYLADLIFLLSRKEKRVLTFALVDLVTITTLILMPLSLMLYANHTTWYILWSCVCLLMILRESLAVVLTVKHTTHTHASLVAGMSVFHFLAAVSFAALFCCIWPVQLD